MVEALPDKGAKERRKGFIDALYSLGVQLESEHPATARRKLAHMRRSLVEDRYLVDVLELVTEHGPPWDVEEERAWLLIAGLFALQPRRPKYGEYRRPLGAALSDLDGSPAVEARLRQLIAASPEALPHRLRQVVQLLGGAGVPLDYQALLTDVTTLFRAQPGSAQAHGVHLSWARDFRWKKPSSS